MIAWPYFMILAKASPEALETEILQTPKIQSRCHWNAAISSLYRAAMKTLTEFNTCAKLLKAVADPERLRILTALFDGPKTVSQIAEELGDEVVRVSHHLGVLRIARIVTTKKLGRFVEYAIHPNVQIESPCKASRVIDLGWCRLDFS